MTQDEPAVRRARLTEVEGCALLRVRFEEAGFRIQEHVPFTEDGLSVHLDGFDPAARVGYEYLTTEAGDRAEFTPEVLSKLEAQMGAGKLFLLLVDEQDVDARGLSLAAERFLQVIERVRGGA